jgi:hypothetical protein
MYQSDIADAALDRAPSLARAHATLVPLAEGLDARFVAAGGALAQAYAIVEQLIAALERVTSALDREAADAAVANLRLTADRLARLPEIQSERAHALGEIRGAGGSLRAEVAQVMRTLQFLRVCALNINVVAAGRTEFTGFAEQVVDKLAIGENEMTRIGAELDALLKGLGDTGQLDRQLANECAKVIPHVPRQLAEDARALRGHQAEVAARAERVAEIAREVRGRMATAIGALQIGDITRQRLEHIAGGLRLLLESVVDDPAAIAQAPRAGHVAALLAAQAADTLDTFRHEARLLSDCLAGIAPGAAALLAAKPGGEDMDDDIDAAFFHKLAASVAEVDNVTQRLREADARSHRLSSATSGTAEALANRLRTVHKMTDDVQQMAWNTDLRSYRMGQAGTGLSVIASETRKFSVQLSTISDAIGRSFDRLTQAATSIRDPDGDTRVDAGQALQDSLECISGAGRRMREGLAGLGGDAARIVDMLGETTANVDCEVEVAEALAEAAAELAHLARPAHALDEPALADLLDAIAATYTMAREREIHRRFALGDADEGRVLVDADEEDDGLF